MNSGVFAKWLERQGYEVLQTKSSYWYQAGPRILQAFPYHWIIEPDEQELKQLLQQNTMLGLRYSLPADSQQGAESYHVVYDAPEEYAFPSFPKKARHDIRKGQDHFEFQEISWERMATEGWDVRMDTLRRQNRVGAEKSSWWQKMCHSAEGLEGLTAWGATQDGKLAACLLAYYCDDCCSILYQQSRSESLEYGVNNAITYTFVNHALQQPKISWIFYGLHSLDAPESVDAYKYRMNFRPKQVKQRVVLHPLVKPFVTPTCYRVIDSMKTIVHHPLYAKVNGFLRFYLDGLK